MIENYEKRDSVQFKDEKARKAIAEGYVYLERPDWEEACRCFLTAAEIAIEGLAFESEAIIKEILSCKADDANHSVERIRQYVETEVLKKHLDDAVIGLEKCRRYIPAADQSQTLVQEILMSLNAGARALTGKIEATGFRYLTLSSLKRELDKVVRGETVFSSESLKEIVKNADPYAEHTLNHALRQLENVKNRLPPTVYPDGHDVISVHGIRTHGVWQKELVPILSRHGFCPHPDDYGKFSFWKFINPWARQTAYTNFVKRVEHLHRPSVIAHSHGTYLVARALNEGTLDFHRIIFVGSLVSRYFPWHKIINEKKRCRAVLNETAGKDLWVKLAPFVVRDADTSGVYGFINKPPDKVVEHDNPTAAHSGALQFKRLWEKDWIRFLRDRFDPHELPGDDQQAPSVPSAIRRFFVINWRIFVGWTILLLLLSAVAASLVSIALFLHQRLSL